MYAETPIKISLDEMFDKKITVLKVSKEYVSIDEIYKSIIHINGINKKQLQELAEAEIKYLLNLNEEKNKELILNISKDNRLVFRGDAERQYLIINSMWQIYGNKYFTINNDQLSYFIKNGHYINSNQVDCVKTRIRSLISLTLLYREIRKDFVKNKKESESNYNEILTKIDKACQSPYLND